MNSYIIKLNEHLTHAGTMAPSSVLGFLCDCYMEYNPVQTDEIRRIQDALEPFFDSLPNDRSNLLFSLLYDLCSQYERTAFSAGLQTAARLMFEIDPPTPTQE